MEIRGKAWRPGDLKPLYKVECICPTAFNDQAAMVEAAADRVRAELIVHSSTEKEPELYYNIPSYEYKSLIKDVREKALKEGRKEAWDLARRIVTAGEDTYTFEDMRKIFGADAYVKIFDMPIDEVLSLDKKHQEEKEVLHVGDEVEFTAPGPYKFIEVYKGYVIRFDEESPRWVSILTKDGLYYRSPVMCVKTGKHNPYVEKVMAAFEKGENK